MCCCLRLAVVFACYCSRFRQWRLFHSFVGCPFVAARLLVSYLFVTFYFLEVAFSCKSIQSLPRTAASPEGLLAAQGPNLFLSLNYQSAVQEYEHPPPAAIVKLLGLNECRSCAVACSTCKTQGCAKCRACSLHLDEKDQGATISMFYQHADTPPAKQCYFCIGDDAFSMAGGFCVVFNARTTMHGVYAPFFGSAPWYGSALVSRSVQLIDF